MNIIKWFKEKLHERKLKRNLRKAQKYMAEICGGATIHKAEWKEADFGYMWIVEFSNGSGYTFFMSLEYEVFDWCVVPTANDNKYVGNI